MLGMVETAGERLAIDSELDWVAELIAEGCDGELRPGGIGAASVSVHVEKDRRAFDTSGWQPLTRGAWRRDGLVVVENVCTAGFDMHLSRSDERVELTFRWRPPRRDRAAARVLRSRFHLLARAALIQYPALWRAGTRGRVPLHASACRIAGATPMLAAASGVGRSTLLVQELEGGASCTGDNLAVGDGTTLWGLVEPLRVEGGRGRGMPHGRQERRLPARDRCLEPTFVVTLDRGLGERPTLSPCTPHAAARALVTATYMAGELRRYWAFAATLTAATGMGPSHPPIAESAASFASALPCFVFTLGRAPGARLSELLDPLEVAA
jgi:hypothetical protein